MSSPNTPFININTIGIMAMLFFFASVPMWLMGAFSFKMVFGALVFFIATIFISKAADKGQL